MSLLSSPHNYMPKIPRDSQNKQFRSLHTPRPPPSSSFPTAQKRKETYDIPLTEKIKEIGLFAGLIALGSVMSQTIYWKHDATMRLEMSTGLGGTPIPKTTFYTVLGIEMGMVVGIVGGVIIRGSMTRVLGFLNRMNLHEKVNYNPLYHYFPMYLGTIVGGLMGFHSVAHVIDLPRKLYQPINLGIVLGTVAYTQYGNLIKFAVGAVTLGLAVDVANCGSWNWRCFVDTAKVMEGFVVTSAAVVLINQLAVKLILKLLTGSSRQVKDLFIFRDNTSEQQIPENIEP